MGEPIPAVDEKTLRAFLQEAESYIRKNPLRVDDEKVTSEMLDKKPFLYVTCQARARNECPYQQFELPNCDRCNRAEASAQTLHEIGPEYGFTTDNISNRYPGTGTLTRSLQHGRGDPLTFEVDGDNHGIVTIYLHYTRCVFTSA